MMKEPLMRSQQKLPILAPGVPYKRRSRRNRRVRVVCMRLFLLLGGLALVGALAIFGMNALFQKPVTTNGLSRKETKRNSKSERTDPRKSRYKKDRRKKRDTYEQGGSNDAISDDLENVEGELETISGDENSGSKYSQSFEDSRNSGDSLYSSGITVKDGANRDFDFEHLHGKVTLIVNVASQCGFTDRNYRGLTKLYEKYSAYGLEILAFPCNSFKNQEPWTYEKIVENAQTKYDTKFPIMQKLDEDINDHPLFQWLTSHSPNDEEKGITWNFNKFLISKTGQVAKRYDMNFDLPIMEQDVYKLLTDETEL